jgi:hypothetical protein
MFLLFSVEYLLEKLRPFPKSRGPWSDIEDGDVDTYGRPAYAYMYLRQNCITLSGMGRPRNNKILHLSPVCRLQTR